MNVSQADGGNAVVQTHWQQFDTASVPSSVRKSRWSEIASETLSEMVVRTREGHDFQASLKRIEVDDIGLVLVETSPAVATSTSCRTGQWATPERDALVLTVADHGHSILSQDHWSVELAENDIAIRDLGRPWRSTSTSQAGLILVKLPYSTALRKLRDPGALIGRRLSGTQPYVATATAIIRACRNGLLSDPGGDWHLPLADVLSDVFRLLDDPRTETASLTNLSGHGVRRAALTVIRGQLFDPALTVQEVAKQVGVSTRSLQRAFLLDGTSPRQYIVNARLDEAARQIAQVGERGAGRITDIALGVGFNDISHFSRMFSRRFGCPPSQYRRN